MELVKGLSSWTTWYARVAKHLCLIANTTQYQKTTVATLKMLGSSVVVSAHSEDQFVALLSGHSVMDQLSWNRRCKANP